MELNENEMGHPEGAVGTEGRMNVLEKFFDLDEREGLYQSGWPHPVNDP